MFQGMPERLHQDCALAHSDAARHHSHSALQDEAHPKLTIEIYLQILQNIKNFTLIAWLVPM
jgi:hypothetical protein